MRSLGTTGIANSRDRLRRCSRVGGARGCGNRLWQRHSTVHSPTPSLLQPLPSPAPLLCVACTSALAFSLPASYNPLHALYSISSASRPLALPHYYGNEVSATARNASRSLSPFFCRRRLRLGCHTQGDRLQRPCRGTSRLHSNSMSLIKRRTPVALRSQLR